MSVLKILGGATVQSLTPYLKEATTVSTPYMEDNPSTSFLPRRALDTSGATVDSNELRTATEMRNGPSQIPSSALLRTEKMSLGQARFWFLKTYLEDQTTSNITATYRLTGEVRVPDLTRAVREVGEQHEALRTIFYNDKENDQLLQGVLKADLHQLRLEHKQIKNEEDLATESRRLLDHVYDLERGESMRIMLLSSSPSSHFLLIAYHHINMDGVSLQVLLSDLEKAYNRQKLTANILQFPDFSIRQRREIEDGTLSRELDFWRNEYPDFPPVLPLFPMSRVRSRVVMERYHLNKVAFRMTSTLASRIKKTSRGAKATSFHFYLSVFKSLLHRFLLVDDLCIGIADANRNDFDTMEAIGMYLNLIPLRFRSKAAETFAEVLVNVKAKVYAALAHSRLPYDVLLEKLNVPRSANHSPLFQAFVDYRQGLQEVLPFGNCKLDGFKVESGRTAYDITLDITESTDKTPLIVLKTQSYLYSQNDTRMIMNSYINLLEAYATDPGCLIEQPSLFRKEDVGMAIAAGQGPRLESDWESTLPHRIDEIVKVYPARLAVKDGVGNALTYSQLHQRVNDIAFILLTATVTEGSRVAVFQEPTADWICSLVAILRIGAVYVPLDLRNPAERLAAIVEAAKPSVILTHAATTLSVAGLKCNEAKIIDISSLGGAPASHLNQNTIQNKARAESLAVILFTSGTTGTPKGIMLRHASLRNEIEGYTKTWNVKDEIILQQSAFSFDFSMDQIFSALSTGSTLYVVPKEKRGDPIEIAKIISTESITYTKATPSEYASWIRYGATSLANAVMWRKAFAGGEPLKVNHLRAFRSLNMPQLHLFNSYGPGEISISSHKIPVPYDDEACNSAEPIPAGKCLPNYSVYIVDKDLQPVPIGVPGEVLIGGPGCAMGYLNNDDLTRQKFILNTRASPEYIEKGWTTAYRSGDRGRLRADGALLFDGRIEGDTQIKLRGLRIELGEIESSIVSTSNGAVSEAVVSVRGDPEFLVAHVILSPDHISAGDDGRFLGKLKTQLPLPQYMCPAMIIPLERMPLTPHLKIDRRAIATLELPKSSVSNEELSEGENMLSDTELKLRDVWKAVISREAAEACNIVASTDFFHIGGSSMLLPKLQAKIRSGLDTVLPLTAFFQASTLRSMATKIEETASASTIDWVAETDVCELAFDDCSLGELGAIPVADNANGATEGKTVLLTGTTGFLGRAILQKLVDANHVSKIHCLSVRPKDGSSQERIAIESEKVIIHEGDLSEPLLGLTASEFAAMASSVDIIIHSGAMRAFFEYYQLLRNTNFVSTRQLIKMALPKKIPFHFVSSGGLLQLDTTSPSTTSVASLWKPPTDGSEGYLATKWASEVVLENAAKRFGVPVYIHRALMTTCTSDKNQHEEVLQTLLKMTKSMMTLPDLAGWAGHFDLVPTASIVDGICKYIDDRTLPLAKGASFEHYPGQIRVVVNDICSFMEKNVDVDKYQRLNILKWLGRVKTLGFGYVISAQYLTLQSAAEGDVSLLSKR